MKSRCVYIHVQHTQQVKQLRGAQPGLYHRFIEGKHLDCAARFRARSKRHGFSLLGGYSGNCPATPSGRLTGWPRGLSLTLIGRQDYFKNLSLTPRELCRLPTGSCPVQEAQGGHTESRGPAASRSHDPKKRAPAGGAQERPALPEAWPFNEEQTWGFTVQGAILQP